MPSQPSYSAPSQPGYSATPKRTRFALRLALILLASACLAACAPDDACAPEPAANPLPVSFCATVSDSPALSQLLRLNQRSASAKGEVPEGRRGLSQDGSNSAASETSSPLRGTPPLACADRWFRRESLNTSATTRTASGGDQWLATDRIGIIMATAGSSLIKGSGVLPGGDNAKYAPAGISTDDRSTATFAPADPGAGPMYYPATGNVDFYAYYPYTPKGDVVGQLDENYNFKIDLSDQSDPAAIDVLCAQVEGVTRSAAPVHLPFHHMFAKVTLCITAGAGISHADVAALTAGDVKMEILHDVLIIMNDDIAMANGEMKAVSPYREASAPQGVDAVFSCIVIRGSHEAVPVSIRVGATTYTATLPAGQWQSGMNYAYPLTIRRTGIEVGTPSVEAWTVNPHNDGTGQFTPVDLKDFVEIPAGTFIMGSPETEENRDYNEQQHEVTLTHSFRMAKYETTNAQYAAFLNAIGVGSDGKCPDNGSYPAARHPGQVLVMDCTKEDAPYYRSKYGVTWDAAGNRWKPMDGYADCPANFVTWYGADEYARRLGASLPTEAQWEYACRAGTTTAYSFGNDGDGLGDYGWYGSNSGVGGDRFLKPHPIGTKKPNNWGLYDMHGNAMEWCLDSWDGDYSADPAIDPVSPFPDTQLGKRVRRGGSYGSPVNYCRSACRDSQIPGDAGSYNGFRIVFN